MSRKEISQRYRQIAASRLVEAVGDSLTLIKREDELSDPDLGASIGKGEDAARAYRTGYQTMDMVTFLRGCERWNGRFANEALAMIGMKLVPLEPSEVTGREAATKLTGLLLEMSMALEDGQIDDRELVAMRGQLDEAGRAIDAMRERLGPKGVRA